MNTQTKITNALDKAGAFFAFSQEQYDAKADQSLKYSNLGGGLLCPESAAAGLQLTMATINHEHVTNDIKKNGITNIIKRELWNHEAFYTGDIEDTYLSIKHYGITCEQIAEVYKVESQTEEVINSL